MQESEKEEKKKKKKCWVPVKLQSKFTSYNGEKDAQIVSMDSDEVTAFRGHSRLPTGKAYCQFIRCFYISFVPTGPRVVMEGSRRKEKRRRKEKE